MTLGIVIGIINLRNFQAMRKRKAAILMLNSFQTMEFVRGLLYIFDLPDKATNEDLESLPEDKFMTIYLVDDAFSCPIIQSWVKLGKYVDVFRARVNRETGFELFQWLAERIMEREQHSSAVPAYVAHRNWKAK